MGVADGGGDRGQALLELVDRGRVPLLADLVELATQRLVFVETCPGFTRQGADLNAAVTRANTARIQKESAYNQVKAALARCRCPSHKGSR